VLYFRIFLLQGLVLGVIVYFFWVVDTVADCVVCCLFTPYNVSLTVAESSAKAGTIDKPITMHNSNITNIDFLFITLN
jgi:hypothetical protein